LNPYFFENIGGTPHLKK
jgi:hypothetical protein